MTLQTAGEDMAALDRAKENIARMSVEIEQIRADRDALHKQWEKAFGPRSFGELSAEIEKLRDLSGTLKLQARCHSQEARGANSTIAEIYQLCTGATGEPGNWNGAEPVRAVLDQLRKDAERWQWIAACEYPEDSLSIQWDGDGTLADFVDAAITKERT